MANKPPKARAKAHGSSVSPAAAPDLFPDDETATGWFESWTRQRGQRRGHCGSKLAAPRIPLDGSQRAPASSRCQPAARHLGVVVLNRTAPDPALYDAHL